ncbi:MAG: heliorhodopsin HeR [Patescibacteria group bacterium]|nr:heliorhodopsin HeR [Patescibacteria group bacterium]MDD5716009.1 heliorhodopsin HeR [Patescibacteria group bacterium]
METATTVPQPEEIKLKKLKRFNIIMAFLHAVQGVLMLILSSDFSVPVTTAFVKMDFASGKLQPSLNTLFDIPIGPLVAAFLFLSAIAHASISLVPGIHAWYNRNLLKGMNLARWVEYSFSSSLMIVVIALLVGVYDGISLMLLFFLNAMMILFGWVMELHNQTTARTNWTSYIFGCIAGAIPWVAVALYLFSAGEGDAKPPTFVYWIYFSIFLFFNVFAANMVLQYKKTGKWRDYLYGERAYIILSLVAKSLLAWQVWAGTLRPV